MTQCLNCGEDFDNKWSFDENRYRFKLYTKICFQCLSENFSIYKSQRFNLPNTKPIERKKDELKLVHLNYGKYSFEIYQRIREAKISKDEYVINENIKNFTPEMINLIMKYMTELSLSNFKTRAMKNVDTTNIYTHSYQDCGTALNELLPINSSNHALPQEAIATGKTWTLLKKKENRREAIHVNAMLDWAKKKNEIIIVSFPDKKLKVDFFIFLPYFKNIFKRDQFHNKMKQNWTEEVTKLSATKDKAKYKKSNTKDKAKYKKSNTLYYSKYKFTNQNNNILKVNHLRVKQNPNDVYILYLPIRFFLWENIFPGLKKDFFCQNSDTNCKVVNKKILNMLPNIPFKNNDFMLSKTLFDNQNYEPNPFGNPEIIKSNSKEKKKSPNSKIKQEIEENNSSQKSKNNSSQTSKNNSSQTSSQKSKINSSQTSSQKSKINSSQTSENNSKKRRGRKSKTIVINPDNYYNESNYDSDNSSDVSFASL